MFSFRVLLFRAMFLHMHYLAACAHFFYGGVYGAHDAVLGFRNIVFLLVLRRSELELPCEKYRPGLSTAVLNKIIFNELYKYCNKTDAMRAEFRATASPVVRERVLIRTHEQIELFCERDYHCAARASINHEAMLFLAGRSLYDVHCAGKETDAYIAKCMYNEQARLSAVSRANRNATWAMACSWCGRYQPQLLKFCDADCIAKNAAAAAESDED